MRNQKIFDVKGIELYLADDLQTIVKGDADCDFDGEFIVFDLETTGLNAKNERITEICARKVNRGGIVDEFISFVNPEIVIPRFAEQLTGITNETVKNAETIDTVLREFIDFCGDSVLIGYNMDFAMSFIKQSAARLGITYNPPCVDIFSLSRSVLPDWEKYNMKTLCEFFDIDFDENSSLPEYTGAEVEVFIRLCEMMKECGITNMAEINDTFAFNYDRLLDHINLYIKDSEGYELLNKYAKNRRGYRAPVILKSRLQKCREHILTGSGCARGQLYKAVKRGRPFDELLEIASFYDYIEVLPTANLKWFIDDGYARGEEDLIEMNTTIVSVGEKLNKPVLALRKTCFADCDDSERGW